jgi:cytoskeletal protein CcmA (bactofilin family)
VRIPPEKDLRFFMENSLDRQGVASKFAIVFDIRKKPEAAAAGSTPASSVASTETKPTEPARGSGKPTSSPASMTTTVLTAETEFKGVLAFSGELQLHGRLEGSIEADSGTLTVGETAVIKADIVAKDVIIYGKVQGNIKTEGKLELRGKAQLFGDVKANRFLVEDGATFVGRSESLTGKSDPAADFTNIFSKLTKTSGKPA